MPPMSPGASIRRGSERAAFLWRVLLIVPPVLVLSAVSLLSLRQDRASIEEGARSNAAVIAPALAHRLGQSLGEALSRTIAEVCTADVRIDTAGRDAIESADARPLCAYVSGGHLVKPVEYATLPEIPGWPQTLTARQAQAWQAIDGDSPASARDGAAQLATASDDVRLNAEWSLLRRQVNRKEAADAARRLLDLAGRATNVVTESGTPISALASILALRDIPAGPLPDSLLREIRSQTVDYPSFLTSELLAQAHRKAAGSRDAESIAVLESRWLADEQTRAIARRLATWLVESNGSSETWVDESGVRRLALLDRIDAGAPGGSDASRGTAASRLALVPSAFVERTIERELSAAREIPGYASVYLRIGERLVPALASRVQPSATLASVAGEIALGAGRVHPFRLVVQLADSDALYAGYRRRLLGAIGLVLAATFAALLGLTSTWRAFERQRRLAEIKSNFVSSVSHELRAPIASVTLMAESLERGTLDGPAREREYLRLIVQECRRLSSLVGNILDFSRIEQGRSRYGFEPTDVRDVVQRTLDVMRPYAEQRNVTVTCALPADADNLPRPMCDPAALQQALVNLVDNAVKHSPAGSTVTIGIEHVVGREGAGVGEREEIHLYVNDRGPGIPEGERERIFEPFYRGGSELLRETPGIGIGLTIVRHIAEAHEGRVVVESNADGGSRFTVVLPVVPGHFNGRKEERSPA